MSHWRFGYAMLHGLEANAGRATQAAIVVDKKNVHRLMRAIRHEVGDSWLPVGALRRGPLILSLAN